MRMETMCSCGANVVVEWEDNDRITNRIANDAERARTLLAEFRRDHKACRIAAAAALPMTDASDERRIGLGGVMLPPTVEDRYDEGYDAGVDGVWLKIVCSVCGLDHDQDESAACDGCEPITFEAWVDSRRGENA